MREEASFRTLPPAIYDIKRNVSSFLSLVRSRQDLSNQIITYSKCIEHMVWAHSLFILNRAEFVSFFSHLHQQMLAQSRNQLFALLMYTGILRQLFHDQLLDGSYKVLQKKVRHMLFPSVINTPKISELLQLKRINPCLELRFETDLPLGSEISDSCLIITAESSSSSLCMLASWSDPWCPGWEVFIICLLPLVAIVILCGEFEVKWEPQNWVSQSDYRFGKPLCVCLLKAILVR